MEAAANDLAEVVLERSEAGGPVELAVRYPVTSAWRTLPDDLEAAAEEDAVALLMSSTL